MALAMHLLEQGAFMTAEGAAVMVERLWCCVEHCPSSAVSFYRSDFLAAKTRCQADSYSLLGLVSRKKPSPNVTASRAYYQEALKRMPEQWSNLSGCKPLRCRYLRRQAARRHSPLWRKGGEIKPGARRLLKTKDHACYRQQGVLQGP